MSFLEESVPRRGVLLPVLPGISRIVANNPSVMTYHGTNSWFIERGHEVVLIDPGPDDKAHLHDILSALGGQKLKYILLTHTHSDHSGNASALKEATGAPIIVYKRPLKENLVADFLIDDGDIIDGLKAVYTPGHASDHLCYQFLSQDNRKILFSGDHVMSWSSSIVNPPDGDMLAYYRSLELLLRRDDDIYLCGHGPLLEAPQILTAELLTHRQFREKTIIVELQKQDYTVASLAARLYRKDDVFLKIAAQRNVLAHLLKLTADGVAEEGEPSTKPHPDILAMMKLQVESTESQAQTILRDSMRRFSLK